MHFIGSQKYLEHSHPILNHDIALMMALNNYMTDFVVTIKLGHDFLYLLSIMLVNTRRSFASLPRQYS